MRERALGLYEGGGVSQPNRRLFRGFFGVMFAVPVKSLLEALLEENGGLVGEKFAGFGDIGERVANVAVAGGFEEGRNLFSGDAAEKFQRFVERDAVTGTDIEDAASGAARFASQQVGADGIFNVGEI